MSRIYSEEKDLQSILNLLAEARPADRVTDFPGILDLREMLALSKIQETTRLWFDKDNQIVAFSLVDQYNNLWFEMDRWVVSPTLETELFAWAENCIRRTQPRNSEPQTLDTSCLDEDVERIALLERHGFIRQEVYSLHLARSLQEPIPFPLLPEGFSIRPLAGEQEVEAIVALHRAAFGTQNMTVEERLAMMRVPGYDSELDLVAVAPDGRLAAYCMCSISQEENMRSGRNEGKTDPVATHPDYQGLGLAKVLLLAGSCRLRQRGVDTAVLGTNSENIAMQRAAQAVGFSLKSVMLWFSKEVSR